MRTLILTLTISTLLLSSCAHKLVQSTIQTTPEERLAHQIALQMDEPELETAFIGLMVQSVETGEILFQHNAKKVMLPASNEKIPTAAAALVNFGPDFQIKTKIYADGHVDGGTLFGNLVIVGGGDPTIGQRLCELQDEDSCAFFESWVQALRDAGIESIKGDIIGIDDVFDDEAIGYGWTVDNLSYSYAAQIGGLTLHESFARLSVTVDSAGQDMDIFIRPDYGQFIVTNNATISDDKKLATDMDVFRVQNTNEIIISGRLLVGKRYRQNISVHNPTEYFLHGLRYELAKSGILISGDTIDADDLTDSLNVDSLQLIYVHQSPPMSEIITILLKESQNLYAESLVKLLGAHFGAEGTFAEGRKVLQRSLTRFGLEPNSYAFNDGSGLNRYNYISPYFLTKILRRMHYHKYGEIFRSSLPIAGIDGTIGYRMKGTVAQSNVQAKTGTISNVRCLSGYVTTRDDEELVFSIMVNNYLCSTHVVMDFQDRICMLLAGFSRQ